jgi:hypothetical protein
LARGLHIDAHPAIVGGDIAGLEGLPSFGDGHLGENTANPARRIAPGRGVATNDFL